MFYSIAIPALIAFLVTLAFGPAMINFLHKLKFGQFIREEGPESHQKKSGTPTMGGILFLVGIVLGSVFYVKSFPQILPILLVTLGFGVIGFLDDYIKVVMKRNLGLTEIQKLAGQLVVSVLFAFYLVKYSGLGTDILIPFLSGKSIDLGILYIPVVLFVVIGTANGANFTDGLDGLASSVTTVIAVFITVASMGMKAGIQPIAAAVIGALLGFLCFNTHPAKVFMGDTGSLALGGFVAASAFMLKMPLFLPIIAFIYFGEVLSVIIQVSYYKRTKKRVFKMAPIHHHFELCGWPETKVVSIFTVVSAVLCLIGMLAM
ncbi:MAG: phospho-N-acetylmuramoyl-pentapeptide-transferase [Eubacteriales bacterium]|nr:phospho-N-acetylmuramoyl-pentapeptide-transferase [Eubacteriales bacterium]